MEHKKYILIIDDSKTINKAVSSYIQKEIDIEILNGYCFADAIDLVSKHKNDIELAIIDLNLPDSKDKDAAKYALKNDIPTIIFTADYDDDTRSEFFQKDILDYFIKEDKDCIIELVKSVKRTIRNKGTKVLVVDDSPTYLSLYKKILQKQLLNVFFASSASEAMQIFNEHEDIKLVLTDYNMPNTSGLTLTSKMRKIKNKEELSIIAVSDMKQDNLLARFLKKGANDFVNKPFSKEELIVRIDSSLDILNMFKESKDKANKDFLTGMFNRRYFFDDGAKFFNIARQNKENIYVAMLDIDHFKNINDTYGHDIGDIAIKEIAKILNKHLKEFAPIIARFGGEEFCVIIKGVEEQEAKLLYEIIRESFEKNIISSQNISFSYTVSIGVHKSGDETLDEAVKQADNNLYEAKNTGRNKVVLK